MPKPFKKKLFSDYNGFWGAIIVVNCSSYFLESEFTEFNEFSEL